MRVRLAQDVRLYWNYAVQNLEKGTEHIGDLARHLLDNTAEGAVEVLEADPEPPKPDPQDPQDPDDPGGNGETGQGGAPPVDGTIDALMTWVGDDKERAAEALADEQAKDNPRSTAVKRLTALADADEQ